MQALRKVAPIVVFSATAWLVVACERSSMPTAPPSEVTIAPPNSNLFGFSSSPAYWVNDDDPSGGGYVPPGTSCDHPGFPTIQTAVLAAPPGTRINVCPGLYQEQVIVPAGKDNIQLRSVRPWEAIIKAPDPMLPGPGGFSIVNITGAHNVTLLAFTVTGPGPGTCGSIHYGVRIGETGSAFVLGNHITDIRDEPLSGCQNGVAVGVGRLADATIGSAWIVGNVIERYQKNGPTVSNVGSSAVIAYNRVLGVGPTTAIAQNGIQVSGGATAAVAGNFVAQNTYTGSADAASSGILLYASGHVTVDHNTVASNDVNIWSFLVTSPARAADNRVRAATFDGVAVQLSTGTQVAHNWIDHNSGPGVGVYDAANNSVGDNTVEYNDDSGILLDGAATTNNTIGRNWVHNNGTAGGDLTDGIRANLLAVGNTIRDNRLRNNVTHDCHDANVAGNSWINNRGQTSFPPGLCRGGDGGSSSERSSSFGWNSSFPWYMMFGEFSNPTGTSTINTESLLQSLPATRTGTGRPSVSPQE